MTEESGIAPWPEGLSLSRLAAFLAVAEAGGLARAAPGDPTRQSQLSRQVRDVERALGVQLLTRHAQGVALTASGTHLVTVLRDLQAGLALVRDDTSMIDVTLAAGDSLLRWLILPRLPEALSACPRISATVAPVDDGWAAVREGYAHLGVARSRPREDGLRVRRLGVWRYALFVPRSLTVDPRDAEGIAGLPFVAVTAATRPLERLEKTLRRKVRVALHCVTFPQAARAVATGAYAAVLPMLAESDVPAAMAVPIPVPGLDALDEPLVLVVRARTVEAARPLGDLFESLGRRLALPGQR
ncbi:MAG: LysR family transcriptional regulator [Chromatiales bacterium]|nr:LysR family transcriptional regulator [Chromatiales bacterium]